MEDETDKDLALEYFDEDLKEQSEDIDEDYEFEPPEENKAKKLNVNNIFIVLIAAVLLVIFIIVFVSKFTQTKKKEAAQLDKAGTKFIPEIEIAKKDVAFDFSDTDSDFPNEKEKKKDAVNRCRDSYRMHEGARR